MGTQDINLPPGKASVSTVPNYCPSACTAQFPETGITLYQTFLHMHQTGAAMVTRHVRGTRELPPIASINAFNFAFNVQQVAGWVAGDESLCTTFALMPEAFHASLCLRP